MKPIGLVGLGLASALIIAVGILFWPTLYRYEHLGRTLVRIHRRDGRNGHPRWWHLEDPGDPGAPTKGSKFFVGSTIEGYGKCQPQWLWEFLRKPLQWKRLDCNPCIVQSCCERSGWESTLGPQIRSRDARQTSINIMSTPQGCWGAAEVLRETFGLRRPPADQVEHERRVASAKVALGETVFEATWAEGRAMTLEQAIEYALAARRNSSTV